MSQADELLNSLSADETTTTNDATEGHIVIGNDRFITVPEELKRIGVQYDHNIETVTFDCPRYWDGIDMSQMRVYINYMLPNGKKGCYLADNIIVDDTDSNIMHFDWTISRNATKLKGNIYFIVCIRKVDELGNLVNDWNSELSKDMYISEGLEYDEEITEDYPDIITSLLERMDAVEAINTIDTTLTMSNVPADSKTVGNKVNELQGEIDNIVLSASESGDVTAEVVQARVDANGTNHATLKARLDDMDATTDSEVTGLNYKSYSLGTLIFDNNIKVKNFKMGEIAIKQITNTSTGIVYQPGEDYPNTKRVRSDFIYMPSGSFIRFQSNEQSIVGMYVIIYDTNFNYVSNSGGYVSSYKSTNDCYIRIVCKYSDEREITDLTVFNDLSTVFYPKPTLKETQSINEWLNLNISVKTGEGSTNFYRAASRFIYAKSGSKLIYNLDTLIFAGMFVFIYDTNFNYIGTTNVYVTEYTVTNDCYIRVVSKYNDEREITDLTVFNGSVILKQHDEIDKTNRYITGDFSTYYTSKDIGNDWGDNVLNSTISDIYNRYDALKDNNPDYISKNLLGYGTSANGDEDTTLPIYEYIINVDGSSRLINDVPTILIQTGTHGDEKGSIYGALLFFEELFNSDHDVIMNIRSNFNFKVIPILNPYGFNNNTRENARNVNINRNLGYMWDKNESTDKGSCSYSEQESKIISDWLKVNNNALLYIDYHNMIDLNPFMSYINTPNSEIQNVYSNFIRQSTTKWRKIYTPDRINSVYGWINNDVIPCTYNEGFYIAGIKYSCTLEITREFSDTIYARNCIKMSLEQLVNFISSMIEYLKNN